MTNPSISNTTYLVQETSGISTWNAPVVRASGEGLVADLFYRLNGGGEAANVTAVLWDPAGANTPLEHLQTQRMQGQNRFITTWVLPTSSSTGNHPISFLFDGTQNDLYSVQVRHVIDSGTTLSDMVRGSAKFTLEVGPYPDNPINDSIASAVDDLIIDFLSVRDAAGYFSAGSGQANVRQDDYFGVFSWSTSSKPGAAGNVAMAWNLDPGFITSRDSAHIIVSLKPAAAGGASTITPITSNTAISFVGESRSQIAPITSNTSISFTHTAAGTLNLTGWSNWSNGPVANVSIPHFLVVSLATHNVVLSGSNLTVGAGSNAAITNANIVQGVDHVFFAWNSDGTASAKKTVTAI